MVDMERIDRILNLAASREPLTAAEQEFVEQTTSSMREEMEIRKVEIEPVSAAIEGAWLADEMMDFIEIPMQKANITQDVIDKVAPQIACHVVKNVLRKEIDEQFFYSMRLEANGSR